MAIKDELLELLRTDPGFRDAARRELFTEDLLAMPGRLDLTQAADRFLADLLWLKGERIAVVGISRRIDQDDMDRARRRAETLRAAGLPAVAVVIGRDWVSEEDERAVWTTGVEWRVGE